MNLRTISSEKIILTLSIFTALFLVLLYLNNTIFHFSFVLIGVLQEMLTIPCILGQPLLLFFAARGIYNNRFREKKYVYAAIALLIIGISFSVTMFITS
ncbi:hypothetical protein [uncultured Lacinutrix sp.]|uniref:hypothetical protein n=1 Tax=uncultured Lacinutrix sp. TaxID=574032 RepID=UPI002631F701|nr:hypothetical protein [uncultured Lacinutrix sp.]